MNFFRVSNIITMNNSFVGLVRVVVFVKVTSRVMVFDGEICDVYMLEHVRVLCIKSIIISVSYVALCYQCEMHCIDVLLCVQYNPVDLYSDLHILTSVVRNKKCEFQSQDTSCHTHFCDSVTKCKLQTLTIDDHTKFHTKGEIANE